MEKQLISSCRTLLAAVALLGQVDAKEATCRRDVSVVGKPSYKKLTDYSPPAYTVILRTKIEYHHHGQVLESLNLIQLHTQDQDQREKQKMQQLRKRKNMLILN